MPLKPTLAFFSQWQKSLRKACNRDFSTPENRRRAWVFINLLDHGWLRKIWANTHQISPGVFRTNQPSPGRLRRFKARGIGTVLNLRGYVRTPIYFQEKATCEALGLQMVDLTLRAAEAPDPQALRALIALFRAQTGPFVMHCKSGADRTGLGSAIYLMVIKGQPVQQARKMLSVRYIHFWWGKAGILDMFLDSYGAAHAQTGIGFEDWLDTQYDPDALTLAFNKKRGRA